MEEWHVRHRGGGAHPRASVWRAAGARHSELVSGEGRPELAGSGGGVCATTHAHTDGGGLRGCGGGGAGSPLFVVHELEGQHGHDVDDGDRGDDNPGRRAGPQSFGEAVELDCSSENQTAKEKPGA